MTKKRLTETLKGDRPEVSANGEPFDGIRLDSRLKARSGREFDHSVQQMLEISLNRSKPQPGTLMQIDRLLTRVEKLKGGKIALSTDEILLVRNGAEQALTAEAAIALLKAFAPNDFEE